MTKPEGFIDPEKPRIKKTSIQARNCRYDETVQKSSEIQQHRILDDFEISAYPSSSALPGRRGFFRAINPSVRHSGMILAGIQVFRRCL
jgi:hypothetical protein